jgi:hypothetical protein
VKGQKIGSFVKGPDLPDNSQAKRYATSERDFSYSLAVNGSVLTGKGAAGHHSTTLHGSFQQAWLAQLVRAVSPPQQ